jgi:hypothetical protein
MMIGLLEKFRWQYENLKDLVKEEGFKSTLKQAVYFNREMILVSRDLKKPLPKVKQNFDMNLVLLDGKELSKIEGFKFPNKVREVKARAYLRRGFAVFLGVIGSDVIAEQWWINSSHIRDGIIHQDVIWMKLDLKEDEIYAFELFVAAKYRGTPATNKFATSYMHELSKMGYSKILGCYFKDNIPSAWHHRVFKFDEIGTVKRHRFFFLEIKNGKLSIS